MLQGLGLGILLKSPMGDELRYVIQLEFKASNNVAEYEGLVNGLRIAISLEIRQQLVKEDSQLVVNQVQKEYQCLDDNMAAYLSIVWKLKQKFERLKVTHIRRGDNSNVDELARLASSHSPMLVGVLIKKLLKLSVSIASNADAAYLGKQSGRVNEAEFAETEAALPERKPTWMTLF